MTRHRGNSPETPADAFERFIEIVRSTPVTDLHLIQRDLFELLRPFLINPERYESQVHQIVLMIARAWSSEAIRPSDSSLLLWIFNHFPKGTMEERAPGLIKDLRALEVALTKELRPGSVSLVLKPIQYIGTPSGYAEAKHQYKIQVQLATELTTDDRLEAVDVAITFESEPEITIDEISPQPGFSVVGVRNVAGIQSGSQQIVTIEGSVSPMKGTYVQQNSQLINVTAETAVGRVEQYLIARKTSNGAMWRVFADIGPVDAGGLEYSAHLLVPAVVRELALKVETRVHWRRVGEVPASLLRTVSLPRPKSETLIATS